MDHRLGEAHPLLKSLGQPADDAMLHFPQHALLNDPVHRR